MMHLIILYFQLSLSYPDPRKPLPRPHRRAEAPVLGFTLPSISPAADFALAFGSGTSASAVLFRPTGTVATRAEVFIGKTDDRRVLFRVDWVVPTLLAFRGEVRRGAAD
jgi:hypothetical protein